MQSSVESFISPSFIFSSNEKKEPIVLHTPSAVWMDVRVGLNEP